MKPEPTHPFTVKLMQSALFIAATAAAASADASAAGGESASERLAAYIEVIETIRDHWREVGDAVQEEKAIPDTPEAYLSRRVPGPHRYSRNVASQARDAATGMNALDRARWLMGIGANEATIAAYKIAQKEGWELDREDERALAVALFEIRRYGDAQEVLKRLLEPDVPQEQRDLSGSFDPMNSIHSERQMALREWYDSMVELDDGERAPLSILRNGYLPSLWGDTSVVWAGYHQRLTALVLIWNSEADEIDRVRALQNRFLQAGDYDGQILTWLYIAEHPETKQVETVEALGRASNVVHRAGTEFGYHDRLQNELQKIAEDNRTESGLAAQALFEAGRIASDAGDEEPAIRYWERVADGFFGTRIWPQAVSNLARSVRERGEDERAMAQYARLLVDPPAGEDIPEHRRLEWTYRFYRGEAAWQIGQIHLGHQDFEQALDAFRTGEQEHPRRADCGNADAGNAYAYRLYQGLCLEHLGRYREATEEYWKWAESPYYGLTNGGPLIWLRMVAIYESAGRLDTLRRKIGDLGTDRYHEHHVVPVFTAAIEMHEEARIGDWSALIARLSVKDQNYGPEYDWVRAREWEATEAARLLATEPELTVPLLIERLNLREVPVPGDLMWIWFALSLAGTPQATAALAEAELTDLNIRFETALQYALWRSGEPGRKALAERFGPESLRLWQSRVEQHEEPPFPPLPEQIQWWD